MISFTAFLLVSFLALVTGTVIICTHVAVNAAETPRRRLAAALITASLLACTFLPFRSSFSTEWTTLADLSPGMTAAQVTAMLGSGTPERDAAAGYHSVRYPKNLIVRYDANNLVHGIYLFHPSPYTCPVGVHVGDAMTDIERQWGPPTLSGADGDLIWDFYEVAFRDMQWQVMTRMNTSHDDTIALVRSAGYPIPTIWLACVIVLSLAATRLIFDFFSYAIWPPLGTALDLVLLCVLVPISLFGSAFSWKIGDILLLHGWRRTARRVYQWSISCGRSVRYCRWRLESLE